MIGPALRVVRRPASFVNKEIVMRKFVAAVVVLMVGYSLASADDFFGIIKKVDGNKLTVQKLKKGEKGEEVMLTAAENVKVVRAKGKGKDTEAGEAIEGGLKNEIFKSEIGAASPPTLPAM